MLLTESLLGSSSTAATYIEDVFSTYLYTGNSGTQTINNGIDLAGKGGLYWGKSRSVASTSHFLVDSSRSQDYILNTNNANAQDGPYTGYFTFNSTGISISATQSIFNANGQTYVGWTFRKQAKFFDVVTYTGNGANRTIAHNLGSVPGCIMIKRTDTTGAWAVYHRSLANTNYMVLNTTSGEATDSSYWNSTTPTSSVFSLGTATPVNANGGTYVAYLFAHDAGGFGAAGTDNVISCGSYTGNGSTAGPIISLGYEPQWVLIKRATGGTGSWLLLDVMRGWTVGGFDAELLAQSGNAESTSANYSDPNATGFQITETSSAVNASGSTYIYIAIRRGPMKTPTSGTSVFNPVVYTGTNVDNRLVNTDIAPDMVMVRQRNDTVLGGMVVGDRLRGQPYLLTGSTAAALDDPDSFDAQVVSSIEYGTAFSSMNGFWCGNDITSKLNVDTTANNHIAEAFKRAPGFFDVVCYTGTGSALTVNHNLGVTPEFWITKKRSAAQSWFCGGSVLGSATGDYIVLDSTNAKQNGTNIWLSPTATTFGPGSGLSGELSTSGSTYVAYLFATCPGVSKVGSYTGSGTTKQIDCGFTGGARFVLIKRTNSTGDWYVWDSARGIVAGNDPYLLLNSTAAEVTSADYIDTYSAGFEISSTAPAAINANGGSFIFLAIA